MAGDLVVELKRHFLAAGYGPGDRIETEHALAERFGVTRARAREALLALCQQGLLERQPRAGTRVREFDAKSVADDLAFRFRMAGFDASDATEARQVVETAILPLVIRRMTPVLLDRLGELIHAMQTCGDDPQAADGYDREFHLTLLEACGNRTLQAFGGVIESLFHVNVRKRFLTQEMIRRAIDEHRALLDAIADEDEPRALALLREHLHPRRYRDRTTD